MKLEEIGPNIYFAFIQAPKELCSKRDDGSIIFYKTPYYNQQIVDKEQYHLLSNRDIILIDNVIEV